MRERCEEKIGDGGWEDEQIHGGRSWYAERNQDSEDGCERVCKVRPEEWYGGGEERHSWIAEKPAESRGREDPSHREIRLPQTSKSLLRRPQENLCRTFRRSRNGGTGGSEEGMAAIRSRAAELGDEVAGTLHLLPLS